MRRRLLLTGPVRGREAYAAAARVAGWEVYEHPLLEVHCCDVDRDAAAHFAPHWVVVTSSNALPALTALREALADARFACVGRSTAERLEQLGFELALPPADDAADLAARLLSEIARSERDATRVLWPRGSLASELGARLREGRLRVLDPVAYETRPARPAGPLPAAEAVFFASPSAVRRYLHLVPFVDGRGPVAIAIGGTTLRALERRGGDRFAALRRLDAPEATELGACLVALAAEGDLGLDGGRN